MDNNEFSLKVLEAEQSLYNVAKTILYCESDCEDAVQNAILKAYLKIHTLKKEQFFKTWLTRILINECYSKLRENKRIVPYEEYMQEAAVEEEDCSEIYTAIMSLKKDIRITVELYYIEGYSVSEIKDILKIPAGTVKSRLYKGRSLLKSILKEIEV